MRRGHALRNLLVAIAVCGVLAALVVPAIQASREAARRVECHDNLRNISLALRNYEEVFRVFPMGAMHSGPNPGGEPPITASLGPSWWHGIIAFIMEFDYDRIPSTQGRGGPAKHEFCADDMNAAGVRVNRYRVPFMRCPSSSLPVMETPNGPIVLPSYVGIAGGCDIDPDSPDYRATGGTPAGLVAPNSVLIYRNRVKGTGAATGGVVTSSGMLPPCQHATIPARGTGFLGPPPTPRLDCVDGTSNTMIVAEQSDWLLDQNPASRQRHHGDPGWTVGGTGPGGGWLSGTARVDPVPQVDPPGGPPVAWGADCWNLTTVRYPPNYKRVLGTNPLPGCSENHGINNPLQSPHPGGVLVSLADGSVHFITSDAELAVLLRLAIRDDGQAIGF